MRVKMKKMLMLFIVLCCILTSCTSSNFKDDTGIDIVINKTDLKQSEADYTIVMGEPEGMVFPRSFLGAYDKDEDTLNYIKVSEGHMWEIEEIGKMTYNSEGGEMDENIRILKKRCGEDEIPCILFPMTNRKIIRFLLSFVWKVKAQ